MEHETCLQNINRALKELAQEDEKIVFLGEDIVHPYDGAFKVEKELSTLFPDRVISTPISEESFSGMAAGMALMGYKPIVDYMFSDFMTLAFDMILNFASKCVTMYGENREMHMIARSANGGYRGYGPTHSQSMQKYFIGIPNVSVYELSRFHDNVKVFKRMMEEGRPCIFFEEKILYPSKMICNGAIDEFFEVVETEYSNWKVLSDAGDEADVAVICCGGMSNICMDAAEKLMMEDEIGVGIYIPSRIYPCEIEEIYDELRRIGKIIIVDECTDGANWATYIQNELIKNSFDLKEFQSIELISSEDSVVPANYILEQAMLINTDKVVDCCRKMVR